MLTYVPLSVYISGNSLLHRTPPTAKLVALLIFVVSITALPSQPWHTVAVLAGITALYVIARIPFGTAMRQLAPVVPLIALLGLYLWWQNGPAQALTTAFGLVATLAAANLLTLTTTLEELMNGLERSLAPLRRFGVPVDTISLAVSVTIRLIPLMANTVNEVLDARKARGAGLSLTAFGTPVVIRSIRRAQSIGEALMARGAGD
ncbi:energy-coupling factor transporter transmembrane protein EcfT [Corynebacterium sp. Z-1]|uniref:energy-coupling factor transporter transmembrane component T family protein n=1 Tax=Corynebacterium TaxID=1716 RepID=UPI00223B546E|nr:MULTISPECIES: energy-coupling factor transporter transmembrane protein EcfT [Corynebacterium]MCT1627618.1 energy-coupling factor transporter transmembrane protein EcfT [Corynebacterium sanguinis]WNI12417.1 energy-coupling factor transporter transmembrane protein EcfT [Corynebacterium sp. Z-1]